MSSYAEKKKENVKFKRFLSKKRSKKRELQKKETVLRQTPHLLPFLQITEDCITLKTKVMDILQITSRDLYSLNTEDMQMILYAQARFYRSYSPSIKVIALNFPSNTDQQRQYWMKKRDKTTNVLRLRFIDRKLFELEFLASQRANREFFLFIYADTPQLLEEEKNHVFRGMRQSFPLEKISIEKKKSILFMLLNQNSKV